MIDATRAGVTTYDLDQIGRREIESVGRRKCLSQLSLGRNVFPAYLHLGQR